MQCARSVLLILLLLAGSLSPPSLHAQAESAPDGREERSQGFHLEQNVPNPVNPETRIPFHLEESLFERGDSVRVTMRIFNILRQVVAIPVAEDHPSGRRPRLIDLPFASPGRWIAYWDGKDSAGRRVPSGVYYCQLVVDDEPPRIRKLIVLNPRRRRNIIPWFDRMERDRPE